MVLLIVCSQGYHFYKPTQSVYSTFNNVKGIPA